VFSLRTAMLALLLFPADHRGPRPHAVTLVGQRLATRATRQASPLWFAEAVARGDSPKPNCKPPDASSRPGRRTTQEEANDPRAAPAHPAAKPSSPRRPLAGGTVVNRTQALVLGFFMVVVASLVVIRAAAPRVYDHALRFPSGWPRWAPTAFLVVLAAWIGLLTVGVLRRWRWTFWLILVAFLFGVLRVPVAILQLLGVLHAGTPPWYVLFQGLIGLAQLAIGLAMLAGYRRAGVGGAF
jgi:hypothetical protein